MAAASSVNQINNLYIALFGRAPDVEGRQFWAQKLESGTTANQIAEQMFATAPARDFYPNGLSTSDTIQQFYINVLGRAPDAEGLAYWTQQAGGRTIGEVLNNMVSVVTNYSGNHPDGLTSAALFENRADVATAYTTALAAAGTNGSNAQAVNVSQSILAAVNSTTNTSSAAISQMVAQAAALTATALAKPEIVAALIPAGGKLSDLMSAMPAGSTYADLFKFADNLAGKADSAAAITALIPAGGSSLVDYLKKLPAGTTPGQLVNAAGQGTGALEDLGTGSGSAPSDGGGGGLSAAFLVTNTAGVLSFSGSTAGDISITEADGALTFTRDGAVSPIKPMISALNDATGIPTLADHAKFVLSNALFLAIKNKMAADVSLKLTDTTLTLEELKLVEAATSGLVDATNVTATSGSVADAKLLLVTNEGTSGNKIDMKADVAVTLLAGTAIAADLKAIENATTGFVDATAITAITAGSAADVKEMLVTAQGTTGNKISTAANIAVTLSAATAAAADLNAIDGATTTAVNATAITALTGTAADVKTALAAGGITTVTNNSLAVTVSGTTSVTDINTINADSATGVVTATATETAAATLATLTTTNTDLITVTLAAASTAAADLNTIDGKTGVAVNATAITALTGTAADVKTALAATGITTVTNNSLAVTVSGSTSVTDINTINADNATGVVTATATETAAATLATLTTTNTDLITVTLAAASTAAADLNTIDGKTGVAVNATAITALTGAAADVKTALESAGITKAGDVVVTLSGVGSVTDTDAILNATTGVVTTGQLSAGIYANFATGDKIDTGLVFASHTSESLLNDGDLHWNFNSGVLTFETVADSSANVALTLTGIASVTESGGVFTLTHS